MSEPVLPRTVDGRDSGPGPVAEVTGAEGFRQARDMVRAEMPASRDPSRVRREYLTLKAGLALSDVASVAAALVLAAALHHRVSSSPLDIAALVVVSSILVVIVFAGFYLYSVGRLTAADEFRRLLLAVTLVVTSIVTVSFWTDASITKLWIVFTWAAAMVLVLTERYLWRRAVRAARAKGRLVQRTLIVGANAEAGQIATEMRREDLGFTPLGYVCADAWGRPTTDIPMLGHVDELRELIATTGADCIFVASSAIRPEHMAQVNKAARREGIEVRVTANVQEVLSTRVAPQPLGTLMAFSLKPVRLSGVQAVAKRSFDIVATSIGIVLLSPFLLMIVIAVKVSSRGPVLFTQERVGYHGTPFTVLKFRTMVVDAEARLDDVMDLNEATGPMFKVRDDPRVTTLGRFLRRLSLDELPQLINVLRGHMSLVGPRPPLPSEVRQYEDWQMARLEVRPGLTGLWQVSGRSLLSFDDYVRLDLFYIENWSLAFDLFIIAKSIPMLLSRRGAY